MKNIRLIQIVLGVIISFYMTGCTDAQRPEKFSPMEFNIDESVLSDSKTIFNEFSIQLPKIFNQLDPSLLQEIKVVMEKQQVSHIIEPRVVDIYTDSLNNSIIFSSLNEKSLLLKLEDEFLIQIRERYEDKFNLSYFTINGIPVIYYQLYNDQSVNLKIFLLDHTGFQLDFVIKNNRYREYSKLIESSIGTIKRNNTKENN